jgi:hypothetical protein
MQLFLFLVQNLTNYFTCGERDLEKSWHYQSARPHLRMKDSFSSGLFVWGGEECAPFLRGQVFYSHRSCLELVIPCWRMGCGLAKGPSPDQWSGDGDGRIWGALGRSPGGSGYPMVLCPS